jgi:hypothetical protein
MCSPHRSSGLCLFWIHLNSTQLANFEAFTAVMFQVEIFWVVMPCSVVVIYHAASIFRVKLEVAWTSLSFVSCHSTTWRQNPKHLDIGCTIYSNLILPYTNLRIWYSYIKCPALNVNKMKYFILSTTKFPMCSADFNMDTISDTTHIKMIFSFLICTGKHFIGNAFCSYDDSVTKFIHILYLSR